MDVAQRFYVPTCLTLQDFCLDLQLPSMPKRLLSYFSNRVPEETGSGGRSLAEGLIQDKIVTLQILIEVGPLVHAGNGTLALDELISAIRTMYATEQVSVFLAFAMQVLLDVQDTLGSQLVEPLHQLQRTARAAKSTIGTVFSSLEFRSGNHVLKTPFSGTLRAIEDCILRDVLGELRKRMFGSEEDGADLGPYFLLSHQPIICGLLNLAITVRMRSQSESLAFVSASLSSVAHLYNALRKSSALNLPWPDMNLFICIQTPAKLFIGNIPRTSEDCYKRYILSLGVSIQNMSKERISCLKNRRIPSAGRLVMSEKGLRDWRYKSPLMEMLEQRFLVWKPRTDDMIYRLEEVFEAESRSHQASEPEALTQFEGNTPTRNTQLLRAFQTVMCQESPALEFDYIAMHFRCLKLLRRLKSWLAEETASLSKGNFDESRNQLPLIPEFVMQQIMVAEDDPESCVSSLGSSETVTLVNKAASIMSQSSRKKEAP